ncbi:hypothetical protein [Ktedonobacter sp. SOSP1-52]|uniref:hypothetical protein n=1 Tax=Ktedonobacter sp. SOSP1-52 TaxID=2778366 RepID=UPI001915EE18|nr:hypothetical protein [Ktedonobacter sp. SOSP1-52]
MLDLFDTHPRQWYSLRKFRLKPLVWLLKISRALPNQGRASSTTEKAPSPASDEAIPMQLLLDMATHLWRLRQKMLQPGTDQPLEEMRQAFRPFEAAWYTLLEAGLEILDHTGDSFHSGLFLHVLAFQPTPGIVEETVLETIRPTIYYRQRMVQPGEVIVGTPETSVLANEESVDTPITNEQGDTLHE